MVRFASRKTRHHAALSEDFERELTREVLRTELLRVRAPVSYTHLTLPTNREV